MSSIPQQNTMYSPATRVPSAKQTGSHEKTTSCARCNVGGTERVLSAVAGGAMVAYGLKQRSFWGTLLALGGGGLLYRAATGHCYMYDQLGINTARDDDHRGVRAQQGYKHEAGIVVARGADELYRYWRDLRNLPRLIEHLESVEVIDATHSRWIARDPFGRQVEWEAEIHNETPGEMIAWRSMPGSDLDTAGSIHFSPLPQEQGTAVTLSLKYDPPAGRAGAAVARLLGNGVEEELEQALRRFKQVMESGELATLEK